MAEQRGASLKPSTFVSGGLIDDVDVVVTESRFVLWDYNGTISQPQLALKFGLQQEDGTAVEQYYSAGDSKYFVPSKDGKMAVPVGDKTAMNMNSNMGELIASIVNCGFPEDKLEDEDGNGDASVFEGMKAHVNRKAQPKRGGLQTGDDSKGPKTVLVVTKILQYPWDAKKGPGKKTAQAKGAPAEKVAPGTRKAANDTGGLDEQLQGLVVEALGGGELTKQKLVQAVFKAAAKDANRGQLVKRVFEDDFLNDDSRNAVLWMFDGTTVAPLV